MEAHNDGYTPPTNSRIPLRLAVPPALEEDKARSPLELAPRSATLPTTDRQLHISTCSLSTKPATPATKRTSDHAAPSIRLDQLPAELLLLVMSATDPVAFHNFRKVNQRLQQISLSNALISEKCVSAGWGKLAEAVSTWSRSEGITDSRLVRQRTFARINNLFEIESSLVGSLYTPLTKSNASTREGPFVPLPPINLSLLRNVSKNREVSGSLQRTASRLSLLDIEYDPFVVHRFSCCNSYLISTSNKYIAISSLKAPKPVGNLLPGVRPPAFTPILLIPVRQQANLVAMDTSEGLFHLAAAFNTDDVYKYDLTPWLAPRALRNAAREITVVEDLTFVSLLDSPPVEPNGRRALRPGTVQVWIDYEDMPPVLHPLTGEVAPYISPADGPAGSDSTTPPQVEVIPTRTFQPLNSIAICPRTGSIAFASHNWIGMYYELQNPKQQIIDSFSPKAPPLHVSFRKNVAPCFEVQYSYYPAKHYAEPVGSYIKTMADAEHARAALAARCPYQTQNLIKRWRRVDQETSMGRTQDCLSRMMGPFSFNDYGDMHCFADGILAVTALWDAPEFIVGPIDRFIKHWILLRLQPPAKVRKPARLVSVLRGSANVYRLVAVHGRDIVVYSLPFDLMDKARQDIISWQGREQFRQTRRALREITREEAALERGVERNSFYTDTVVAGVYVGSLDWIESINISSEASELTWPPLSSVTAVSRGRLYSWVMDPERMGAGLTPVPIECGSKGQN